MLGQASVPAQLELALPACCGARARARRGCHSAGPSSQTLAGAELLRQGAGQAGPTQVHGGLPTHHLNLALIPARPRALSLSGAATDWTSFFPSAQTRPSSLDMPSCLVSSRLISSHFILSHLIPFHPISQHIMSAGAAKNVRSSRRLPARLRNGAKMPLRASLHSRTQI